MDIHFFSAGAKRFPRPARDKNAKSLVVNGFEPLQDLRQIRRLAQTVLEPPTYSADPTIHIRQQLGPRRNTGKRICDVLRDRSAIAISEGDHLSPGTRLVSLLKSHHSCFVHRQVSVAKRLPRPVGK
jgi:hypothetical protein